MAARHRLIGQSTMVSPWRRRRMCILVGERPDPAALCDISARGAFLETNARPEIGATVELHHPEAGAIAAVVQSVARDGIRIDFDCSEQSVAFALSAITADMSRPPA